MMHRKIEDLGLERIKGEISGDSEEYMEEEVKWTNQVRWAVTGRVQDEWAREKAQKSSLRFYGYKERPEFAEYWGWRKGVSVMFNIIAGSLKTRQREMQVGIRNEGMCICGEVETVEHFVLEFP